MKKRCDCVLVVRVLCKGGKKGGSVLEFFVLCKGVGKKKSEAWARDRWGWKEVLGSVKV